MILGEGVTAAAFFAYFLQLQAKSKGVIEGGFEDLSHLRFTLPEALEGNFMENKPKPLNTSAKSHNLRNLRFRQIV
jgi:hypothetical protein